MAISKRWHVLSPITAEAEKNLTEYPPIMRQVLFNRGYATYREAAGFLAAEPPANTDPFQLSGMALVCDRIRFGVDHGELIAVYGDYDVDGVTATALLVETLERSGARVMPYIPRRLEEGYGLNKEALDGLKAVGVGLVVTVDCGIRSPDEARHARAIGLDLVISDHHHPAEGSLPPAFAVLSPKSPGDAYPDKNLAGVGIAYKIAEALLQKQPAEASLDSLLDLVALGTVADLAPLVGENRFIVRRGIRAIRETKRQGLYSLAGVAEIAIGQTTAGQIGFVLGPRLNAAGRLASAEAALELLRTHDPRRAGELALELNGQNRKRQDLTRTTQARAEELATAAEPNPNLLFAVDETFNPGLVGLAASRLTETYYRPAIVAARGAHETRGSCRSVPEFHITDALDKCADLLVRYGGHAAAAGFTVRNEKLPELTSRLKSIADSQLGKLELRPTLEADAEVGLSSLNFNLLRQLSELEPTGYGNREAVFISRDVKVKSSRTVGAERQHLKLAVEDERGVTTDAIGFRLGHLHVDAGARIDVAYTLESNTYNGRTTLQMNLKDLRASGRQD
jgi:single-stranded-DNA-specific exonuclease